MRHVLFALALLFPSTMALAAPPEVTGVRFDSKTTLAWDALPDVGGFHVYGGPLSGLPGNGDCLLGSVQGNVAEDISDENFYFLVSAFDETGEGTLGADSAMVPRVAATPCKPARRFFELTTNGDGGDGVEDGTEPLRNPGRMFGGRKAANIYLMSGEVFVRALDTAIRARGAEGTEYILEWAWFSRSYRTQIAYDGPLGHGWDFSYNRRLQPLGSDVEYLNGNGRREVFARLDATHFTSPAGRYAVLFENPDGSFRMRFPHGMIQRFHAFDGSNLQGALEEIEDREGNVSRLLYDHQGLLVTVVDNMGRAVDFEYDANGRMVQTTDFAGRQCVYTYDAAGDLVASRTPTVVGTPNGNDFPNGKTTQYGYASGHGDDRLNHNLLTITAPNEEVGGPARTVLSYGLDPAAPDFDRVAVMTVGGTNSTGVAAGGDLTFAYEQLNPGGDPADLALPRRKTTVTDRNGNQIEYVHNHPGNLIQRTDFTNRELRPGEPDYVTQLEYNADGEATRIVLPEADELQFTYDSLGADRYRQGNVLEVRHIAGPRGDGLGGGLNDLVTTYAYDPVYNLRRTVTDPRGNDASYVPQNGGVQSAARYTAERFFDHQEDDPAANGLNEYTGLWEIDTTGFAGNLGDLNGDGRIDQTAGRVILDRAPPVLLDAASNQAGIEGDTSQEVEARYRWNDFGQPTRVTDAEGNVSEFAYYPETDPDGDGNPTPAPPDGRTLDGTTGGYLQSRTLDTTAGADRNNKTDPTPTGIEHSFAWDTVGNLTDHTDGRGVLTKRIYNELNQVVQLRRAAATADAGGPDGDPPTGRGETGLPAFSFKIDFEYDANDNLVARRVEDRGETRGVGPELDTTYEYDILDRRIRITEEATSTNDLVTELRYDANENLIRITEPEGNAHETAYDERDLVLSSTRGLLGPRGGVPASTGYEYDGNGNLVLLTDPRGNPVDYVYDGYDRRVRVIDRVGSTGEYRYDPASRLVESVLEGPVGGPTPGDRLGTTNVELERTEYLYDELYRLIRVDAELFVPAGAPTGRPPSIAEGPLVPADGALNRIFEYDRLSRLTFVREDTGTTLRFDYDGLGRRLLTTLPDTSFIEYHYDPQDNLIERVELEKPSNNPGPPDEEFITTYDYDPLYRLTRVVDNVGETWRSEYDSLDRVTTATDALGPAAGSINRKSPGRTGIVIPINGHGNVRRATYDGAGRLLTRERVLTSSGQGDGTTTPTPDVSNPFNGDGLIRIQLEWDDNSLLSTSIDDRLNETTYAYDNLDRRTLTTHDDGTTTQVQYDENDNLVQRTDANGSVHDHTFDPADRRTMATYAPAAGLEGTTLQTFEYDGLSRLTEATDNNDPADGTDDLTTTTIYDSLGRVIEEQQLIPDGTATQLTGTHWQSSLASKLIYPSNREVEYAYDAFDRLTTVSDLDPARPESASFQYFGMSRVHTRTTSNGVKTTMLNDTGDADIGYDGMRRIVNLRHLDDAGGALLAGFEYVYDSMSNIVVERRPHHLTLGNPRGELYTYDSAYRLIEFQEGDLDPADALVGGPVDAWSFELDGVGNWPEMTRNGQTYGATPNNLNEYDEDQNGGTRVDDGVPDDFGDPTATGEADGVNLAHDKKGDQTLNDNMETAFDPLSRAVRASDAVAGIDVASYRYDARGRRTNREVVNSGALDETLRFTYAGPNVLVETDAAGIAVREKLYGVALDGFGIEKPQGWNPGVGGGTGSGMGSLLGRIRRGDEEDNGEYEYGRIKRDDDDDNGEYEYGRIKRNDDDDNGDYTYDRIGGGTGSGMGSLLWQLLADGTSQFLLEDGRGNTAALVDGASPTVLERVTYDAWGKPTFEDAANNTRLDMGGNFDARSEFGNPDLWAGMRYDPEYGLRTADPNTDRGGYYNALSTYYNPNQGRRTSRANMIGQLGTRYEGIAGGGGGGSFQSKARHDIAMNSIRNMRAITAGGGTGSGGGFPIVLRQGGTVTGVEMFRADGTPLRATMNTTWARRGSGRGIRLEEELIAFRINNNRPPSISVDVVGGFKDISITWIGPQGDDTVSINWNECFLTSYSLCPLNGEEDDVEAQETVEICTGYAERYLH